jgi:hypothetical protein
MDINQGPPHSAIQARTTAEVLSTELTNTSTGRIKGV